MVYSGIIVERITMETNTCKRFATIYAKKSGLSYSEAIKKYPRCDSKNVYWNDCETVSGHCVHCARVDAINKNIKEE